MDDSIIEEICDLQNDIISLERQIVVFVQDNNEIIDQNGELVDQPGNVQTHCLNFNLCSILECFQTVDQLKNRIIDLQEQLKLI